MKKSSFFKSFFLSFFKKEREKEITIEMRIRTPSSRIKPFLKPTPPNTLVGARCVTEEDLQYLKDIARERYYD